MFRCVQQETSIEAGTCSRHAIRLLRSLLSGLSSGLTNACCLQHRIQTLSATPVAKSEFDIPAAPILIPKGPWKAVDGSVNAPKGFKAQGQHTPP